MQNGHIGTDLCSDCDPDAGCAEWRRQFIEWRDASIHRDEQYFTYKHPDEKEE